MRWDCFLTTRPRKFFICRASSGGWNPPSSRSNSPLPWLTSNMHEECSSSPSTLPLDYRVMLKGGLQVGCRLLIVLLSHWLPASQWTKRLRICCKKNQNKSGCDELPTWPFSGLEATQKDNDRQVSNQIANDKNVSAQFCGGTLLEFLHIHHDQQRPI